MLKYSQLVISLPFLVLPFTALPMKSALAETVGIERALELLAKSMTVDGKCNVLSADEHDELSRYTSRAEVSGAEKTSLENTRSALETGRKAGLVTTCSAQASSDVRDTLNAARDAIRTIAQSDAAAPPLSGVVPTRQKPVAKVQKPIIETASKKLPAVGKLTSYRRVTEAYFLERRCAYLSKRQITSFYKAVLKNHLIAISQFGRAEVSKAKKAAEAQANAQRCNIASEARIRAGYSEVASR